MPQHNTFTLCGVLLEVALYRMILLLQVVWCSLFGTGGSVYRQDRVTIYLRMVSTANGKILKSVSKQYYRKPSIKAFKYVNFKRLLR
jgi:curli production assembly/transport component CsgG